MRVIRSIATLIAFAFVAIAGQCQTTTHGATLNWGASTTNGATYNVLRATSVGGTFTVIKTGVTALTYDDANLPANTQFCYEIVAQSPGLLDADPTTPVCGTTGQDKAGAAGALTVIFR
jgi:hypothetical protein